MDDTPVYTYLEVIELIKKDRQAVIEFIEEEFLYDMSNFFEKVPIQLKQ